MPKGVHLLGPTKGANTRNQSTKLADGQYLDLRNLDFTADIGGFVLRKGSKRVNTSALSSSLLPIRGGKRTYHSGTRRTLLAHGTAVYSMSSAGVVSTLASGLTSDKDTFFESYGAYDFSVNGFDAPRRYDGATARTAGFAAPSGGNMVAAATGAGLTGAYSWIVTFIYDSNEAHESSAGYVSNTVTLSSQAAALSGIPTGGTGVTGRKLYRTKAGGSIRYFAAFIQNNTDTTYTDARADSLLGAAQAPADNGVPPSDLKILLIRKNRAYGVRTSNPHILWMSSVTTTERSPAGGSTVHGAGVEIWPASHFVAVGDSATEIVALEWWRDRLVIFKQEEIWLLSGNTPSNFNLEPVGAGVGCAAPRTVKNMGTRVGILFLGVTEGAPMVYRFVGGTPERVADDIEPTLKANVIGLGSSANVKPSAGKSRGQYYLSYSTNLGGTAFETAQFDTVGRRWQFDDNWKPASWIEYDGADDRGELFYGHAGAGWLVEIEKGRGDFTADSPALPVAVEAVVKTGHRNFGSPNTVKQALNIDVTGEAESTAEIDVIRYMNFQTVGTSQSAIDPDGNNTMEARLGGAFHKRIDCATADASIPEQGIVLQLEMRVMVPVAAENDAYVRAAVHDAVVYFNEFQPVSHEQELSEEMHEEIGD